MLTIKSLLTAFIVISLVACGAIIQVPKIAADGKFSQAYIGGNIIVEIEYESSAECGITSNNTSDYDTRTKSALANGSLVIKCSPDTKEYYLNTKAKMKDIVTNKIYNVLFISQEICKQFASDTSTPRYVYTCPLIQ
jgi:hypothetical protein